jgi:uncharacterized membrane protein
MWIILILLLGYFLLPVLLIYLTHVSVTMRKIGAVVLAYAVGLILGNINLFPRGSDFYRSLVSATSKNFLPGEEIIPYLEAGNLTQGDLLVNQIASTQDMLTNITVLIAIPLLLFSLDLKRWLHLAGEAFKSLILALVSLFLAIIIGFLIWGNSIPQSAEVGGLLVGVYTGGTPNLAILRLALQVDQEIYLLTHTSDVVIGAIFLLFLMTVAQRIFNTFLPHFRDSKKHRAICTIVKESDGLDNYLGMLNFKSFLRLGAALLLSIAILGIAFGLSTLFDAKHETTIIVVSVTTLGILASLVKRINAIEYTFQFGMYFIIVFSLGLASLANLRVLMETISLGLFLYVFVAVFGSMVIHVILSKIFKVDTDTTIITITALTYSAPFVPAVAAAIRNKEVIISGLAVGTLGYAFGTYGGLLMAALLRLF